MASRYDINSKTVTEWRKRTTVEDAPMGPRQPRSTVLTMEQEAVIVAFRQHTLLPLDDCLYALQASIPNLTRSSRHRCLQRHGINRLPQIGEKPAKKKFALVSYRLPSYRHRRSLHRAGNEFICLSPPVALPGSRMPNYILTRPDNRRVPARTRRIDDYVKQHRA